MSTTEWHRRYSSQALVPFCKGDLKEATFDAPEVERVKNGATPVKQKSGGPDRGPARREVTPR